MFLKTFFTFATLLRFKRFFQVCQRFLIFFFKNVHRKSHYKLREALLKTQKRINRP